MVFNGSLQISCFPQAWLTNISCRNYDKLINKTGNLSHHLPDPLCQQVSGVIGLRLPNCPVINEWLSSVPSSLLILLYLFGFVVDAAGTNVNVLAFSCVCFPSDASLTFHGEILEVAAQQGLRGHSRSSTQGESGRTICTCSGRGGAIWPRENITFTEMQHLLCILTHSNQSQARSAKRHCAKKRTNINILYFLPFIFYDMPPCA